MKLLMLIASHVVVGLLGFALGIYALPILTAPDAPSEDAVRAAAADTMFTGEFRRDLADSDALHWGEGTVFVGPKSISLEGEIAPGPDYKLYLSPSFVETEADFEQTVRACREFRFSKIHIFPFSLREGTLAAKLDASLRVPPDEVRRRAESLTPRERQVFELVVRGMLNKQVAYELGTSEKTIKVHRARVMQKMQAESLADLVRMAGKLGIES